MPADALVPNVSIPPANIVSENFTIDSILLGCILAS